MLNHQKHQIKTLRSLLTSDYVEESSKHITYNRLLPSPVYQNSKSIHIYSSCENEVDTQYIINHAKKSFKDIFYPTNDPYNNNTSVDLVIIPGILFDKKCNRNGRGRGYYDMYLSKTNAYKVALCYEFQVFDEIQTHEHDVTMDMIITEKEMYFKHFGQH